MTEEFRNSGFGMVTGTLTALSFPEANAMWARIKVSPSGVLGYIGGVGLATFPMDRGDDTGWFPANDMNEFSYRGTGAYFSYWYQY